MKSCVLLLCVVLLTAATGAVFAQTEKPADEILTKFETLRGEVVDSRGNKVENFSVNAALYDSTATIGKDGEPINFYGKWEAKDVEGKFSFDVEQPIAIKPNTRLICRVTAEGYLPELKRLFRRKEIAAFDGNFGKISLKRAVKVTGRLVMPASADDEKLLEPIVRFTLVTKSHAPVNPQRGEFSEDGTFEATLPEDCQMEMIAYSQNAAAISRTITIEKFDPAKDAQNLGEFELPEGVSVSGVVLTRNGSPVENQSVYLLQRLDDQYIHAIATTDALGEFDLAPRLGKVIVRLNEQIGPDGKATNSTGRKLTARPVELTLRAGEAVKPIEFREAETFLIAGSVSLEDGRIPKKAFVAISDQHGTSDDQKVVEKDGKFAFAVPRGSKASLIIMYNGDDEESFFVSSLRGDSLAQNRDAIENYEDDVQIFNFKPIEKNIGPLDFILQEHVPEQTTVTEEIFNWILGD